MDARSRTSDEEMRAVREAEYSDGEIIEILTHVALNTFTNYFNETVPTDIDFPVVNTSNITNFA